MARTPNWRRLCEEHGVELIASTEGNQLVLKFQYPEGTPESVLHKILKHAVLAADTVYREHGGSGLKAAN